MDTRENFTRTSLRIPQELYDQLVEAAAGKNSLNAEIIRRLEWSLKPGDMDDADRVEFVQGVLGGVVGVMLMNRDPIAAMKQFQEDLKDPEMAQAIAEGIVKIFRSPPFRFSDSGKADPSSALG